MGGFNASYRDASLRDDRHDAPATSAALLQVWAACAAAGRSTPCESEGDPPGQLDLHLLKRVEDFPVQAHPAASS